MARNTDVQKAIELCFEDTNIHPKSKQVEAMKNILYQKDTLCILPIAYGKSLTYQALPRAASLLDMAENPVVVILSPLVSLIEDQVESVKSMNQCFKLKATSLAVGEYQDIATGKYNLIYGTPEAWLKNSRWRELLATPFMVDNLVCFVVDEVHKVTWGVSSSSTEKPFREVFNRIGELRSLCRPDLPVLALSATIDTDLTELVMSSCNLSKSLKVISTCSDRPNLYLAVRQIKKSSLDCLGWLVDSICKNGITTPKVIIYCRSVNTAGFVYANLVRIARNKSFDKSNFKDIIGLFHSETHEEDKKEVLEALTKNIGTIRVVVATSSLGCGVNAKDVKFVIHYGPAYHLMDYCQQVGRAGRDGNNSCCAILYNFPQGGTSVSMSMKKYIKMSTEKCLRSMLFTPFKENNTVVPPKEPSHSCCSFCSLTCQCTDLCIFNPEPSTEQEPETPKVPLRSVTSDDKELVKELILDYHTALSMESAPLLAPAAIISGVDSELIKQVMDHLPYIDSLSYVLKNLPVNRLSLAKEISLIVKEVFIDQDKEDFFGDLDDNEECEEIDMEIDTKYEFSDFSISSDSDVSLYDSDF